MEWGARALGNRSILADPRRADMRDLINTKIKFREKFRPFAPSIPFVGAMPDPFMLQVYPVRPDKRAVAPPSPMSTAPAGCRPSATALSRSTGNSSRPLKPAPACRCCSTSRSTKMNQ